MLSELVLSNIAENNMEVITAKFLLPIQMQLNLRSTFAGLLAYANSPGHLPDMEADISAH